jgi:hypothetical protein
MVMQDSLSSLQNSVAISVEESDKPVPEGKQIAVQESGGRLAGKPN